MKKIILFWCFFSLCSLQAQNLDYPKWLIQINVNEEKHDKRWLGYPDLEALYSSQSKEWGTYHYQLIINRKTLNSWNLTAYTGLGVNYEKTSLRRPFDHSYFNEVDSWFRILQTMNRYKKLNLTLPLQLYYTLGGPFLVRLELVSNWEVYKKAYDTEVNFPYDRVKFQFESLEFLSGLSMKINRIMLGADVRILNFQKIDRVIASQHFQSHKVMEWHNPLLFQFSVGYFFGGGAQKPTLR